MHNKNNIPGTNPEWGRNLPDGDYNSLVDSNGENYDNGVNFDERDDGGVNVLADMPEFDKFRAEVEANQEKSFTDAKRDEKLPEDIRDKIDYQEFIAEQRARIKEHEVLDDKLFESIKSIEDSDSRDLATAILPFYYNQSIQRQSEDKQNTRHSAMRDTMQAIVDCVKSDKAEPDSITKVLFEKDKKYFDQDNYDVYRIFRIVEGNERSPGILEQLKEGQKTEEMDFSEANFNPTNLPGYCSFTIKSEGGVLNRRFNVGDWLSSEKEDRRNTTKIVLSIANDLTNKINNTYDLEKTFLDRKKMSSLEVIFQKYKRNNTSNDIEKIFNHTKENRLGVFITNIKETSGSISLDGNEEDISVSLANLIAAKELSDEFMRKKESLLIYNNSLKLGKKILDGEENWQDIDISDIYKSGEKD